MSMLFFKRYLEKSQLVAQNFSEVNNSAVPCYVKMRELPAPRKLERVHDLVALCAMPFAMYTCDWIVDEYFIDHDSDYLVSARAYVAHRLMHVAVCVCVFFVYLCVACSCKLKKRNSKKI
uniref:Uncharacterized protein n=1 Tax=Ceratitis capitata TaxID=7213 RepID=W8BXG2_CERCA